MILSTFAIATFFSIATVRGDETELGKMGHSYEVVCVVYTYIIIVKLTRHSLSLNFVLKSIVVAYHIILDINIAIRKRSASSPSLPWEDLKSNLSPASKLTLYGSTYKAAEVYNEQCYTQVSTLTLI